MTLFPYTTLFRSYKQHKKENVVFKNINFTIYENDRLALLGSNGAGKTTTVEIIAEFRKYTSGSVIKHFSNDIATSKKIGVQFQDLSFPKNLRVNDIINFSINIDNLSISKEEISEMIHVFQMETLMKKKVSKLSGGQQQRLNVFISLLNKPKLLFLDEFSTGLDIAAKKKIKDFILKFCNENKITLVIISHDIDILSEMAERVVLLKDQKIYIEDRKSVV